MSDNSVVNNDNDSDDDTVGDVAVGSYNDSRDMSDNSTVTRDSGNFDIDAAVSLSSLSATTSGSVVSRGRGGLRTGANTVTNRSFANAAGISQLGQNSGHNSNVQQSVSVQAEINR